MLMASFTQNELLARASNNKTTSDHPSEFEKLYDHLRPRVFDAFDGQEKSFYHSGITGNRMENTATVIVPYKGQQWRSQPRPSGQS